MQMNTLGNEWQRDFFYLSPGYLDKKAFAALYSRCQQDNLKKQANPAPPGNKENVEPLKARTKRKRGERLEEVVATRKKSAGKKSLKSQGEERAEKKHEENLENLTSRIKKEADEPKNK